MFKQLHKRNKKRYPTVQYTFFHPLSFTYLLYSLWFPAFFYSRSLQENQEKGKEAHLLLSLLYVPVLLWSIFGLFTVFCAPHLSTHPPSLPRPQGNLPLRCLTSWSGWAWSLSRWFGCLSSTVWPLQSRPSTKPNATFANSVPSRASGGCDRVAKQTHMQIPWTTMLKAT